MREFVRNFKQQPAVIMAVNMLIAMVLYMAARIFFYLMYKSAFADVDSDELFTMCMGGTRFDLSALC